jgi:hypothetical protein
MQQAEAEAAALKAKTAQIAKRQAQLEKAETQNQAAAQRARQEAQMHKDEARQQAQIRQEAARQQGLVREEEARVRAASAETKQVKAKARVATAQREKLEAEAKIAEEKTKAMAERSKIAEEARLATELQAVAQHNIRWQHLSGSEWADFSVDDSYMLSEQYRVMKLSADSHLYGTAELDFRPIASLLGEPEPEPELDMEPEPEPEQQLVQQQQLLLVHGYVNLNTFSYKAAGAAQAEIKLNYRPAASDTVAVGRWANVLLRPEIGGMTPDAEVTWWDNRATEYVQLDDPSSMLSTIHHRLLVNQQLQTTSLSKQISSPTRIRALRVDSEGKMIETLEPVPQAVRLRGSVSAEEACVSCSDTVAARTAPPQGITCDDGHFLCNVCFDKEVLRQTGCQETFDERGGCVWCPRCPPLHYEYPDDEIYKHVSSETHAILSLSVQESLVRISEEGALKLQRWATEKQAADAARLVRETEQKAAQLLSSAQAETARLVKEAEAKAQAKAAAEKVAAVQATVKELGGQIVWECDVDGTWHEYSEQVCTQLEQARQSKLPQLAFKDRGHAYTADFKKMVQVNNATSVARKIQRKVYSAEAEYMKPESWVAQPAGQRCALVQVGRSSPEFRAVRDRMAATMPAASITKLERVQNVDLWDYYCLRRERMMKLAGGVEPNEVSVWHGTGTTDPKAIYEDRQDGFMMQFCTSGMWGRGLYFAENASYSHNYAHGFAGAHGALGAIGPGKRQFMLAKLLSGDEIRVMPNDNTLKMCPERAGAGDPQARKRYDTVTGETNGSKVFIVYENGRAYPEYLVTYTA